MKISKGLYHFNKEILFGEVGAILGSQIFGYISSLFTLSPNIISALVVAGAITGAAIFFLSTRAYHKSRKGELSTRKFAEDLLYFTPVAFILTLLVYYPTLYLLSNYFLNNNYQVIFSTFISQLIAFALFLIAINIYREILIRKFKKEL